MTHSAECRVAETHRLTESCPRCQELRLCDLGKVTFLTVTGITREEFDVMTDPSINGRAPLAALRFEMREANALRVQVTRQKTLDEHPTWEPAG